LSKIQGLEIPHNALLVTGDVTALYTNMEIDKSIEAVKEIFLQFPSAKRPDQEIIDLLEIALKIMISSSPGATSFKSVAQQWGKHSPLLWPTFIFGKFDNRAQNSSIGRPEIPLFGRRIFCLGREYSRTRTPRKRYKYIHPRHKISLT